MKRLLALLAMAVAFSLALISCGEAENDPSQSSEVPQSEIKSDRAESTAQSVDGTESAVDSESTTDSSADESVADSEADESVADSETDESIADSEADESVADSEADESIADSETDESIADSETDESIADSETDESTTDSSTDESTTDSSVDESTTDSSKPEDTPSVDEPDEDEVELNPGIPDGPISIAVGGVSEYVIVYEADNFRVAAFVEKLVEYMKTAHKITIEAISDDQENTNELCIYVGNIKGIKRVKDRLNEANDFGACVFGNDYVLYATNDRLYEYLFDALKDKVLFTIRNGNWNAKPANDFIYSKSDIKDVAYTDYLLSKEYVYLDNEYIKTIFEPLSFTASDGTTLPYRLYVPYDYDPSLEYPVLLFMHGAGERGTNNNGNVYHMFKEMFALENSPLWDSIIIAPQCPEGQQWVDTPWSKGGYRVDDVPESNEIKAALEILEAVGNEFTTDKDRYYVMGLSMGGFATWDLIMRHTELFAAAVPICGGADYTQAKKLVDMPIYTLHGGSDKEVPTIGTKEMVVALEMLESRVLHYEELEGYGHNVWGYASGKAEIWTWLYEQTREGR